MNIFERINVWPPKFYYGLIKKKIAFSKTSDLYYDVLLESDVLGFFIFHANLEFSATPVMLN